MTKKITVKTRTGTQITLNPSDYVTSGGEGEIYKKGSLVYKIFHPGRTGLNALEEKIKLLSTIKHRGIIAPLDALYNAKDELVGFNMPHISGECLVRFFGNDYRAKMGFDLRETITVAQRMKEIVSAAHAAQALIIDGNEMNYLINMQEPYIIDVDSWQIGAHQATAIMTSIRDFGSAKFSTLTDWWSWGIVTFQLFTGIHPFKGRHHKYKASDLIDRIKNNISVFNKDVQLPAAVRDVRDIPLNLRDWYESVFEKGQRTIPPDNFDSVVQPKVIQKTVYKSGTTLKFTKLKEFQDKILEIFPNGAILTESRIFTRTATRGLVLNTAFRSAPKYCISTDHGTILIHKGSLVPSLIEGDILVDDLNNSLTPSAQFFQHGNRLFSIVPDGIREIKVIKLGKDVKCISANTWQLNPNSTYFDNGVGIYDALGMPFVVLPYEDTGCLIIGETSLQKKPVIAAKAIDKFVTCLVKDKSGQNFKVELYYDNPTLLTKWEKPTDETELNFAANYKGTIATIVDDGELVLFSPKTGQSRKITDKHIKGDMKLCTVNDNIGFIKDNELWSITTT